MQKPIITPQEKVEWEAGIVTNYCEVRFLTVGTNPEAPNLVTRRFASEKEARDYLAKGVTTKKGDVVESTIAIKAIVEDTYGARAFESGRAGKKARYRLRKGLVKADQIVGSQK